MPRPRPRPDAARSASGGIDGAALLRSFSGGAAALRRQAAALNAINVFPVPDGDTGTNMSLTMRAAVDEAERATDGTLSGVARAAARGALMGAKGNSGVILSQIIAGFVAPGGDALDGAAFAAALDRGRDAAYRVVSQPREGTILSVITAASAAAARATRGSDVESVLAAAADEARAAVARTPEQMPLLKEAGVVDAGAQGLYVLLEGMLRALRGEEIALPAEDLGTIDPAWLAATERAHEDGHAPGFCTEFVIQGEALDADAIRARLASMGESVLVVGGGALVRVHVHTHEPEDALAYARTLGAVSHEKADDMEAQFQALAARRHEHQAPARARSLAIVAVGAGDGVEALLRSIGAAAVVRGGQTMNPSAGEILAAIDATGARDVIVLPDNKNVILAAQQAARASSARVHVVPSRSVPQGIAALIAANSEAGVDENVAAMSAAIVAVRTGEVTHAARATTISGLSIAQGQPIGLVDGELCVAEPSIAAAVRACVARMLDGGDASLVTLYAGEGEDAASAEALAEALRAEFGVDVEVAAGGQPHYPYLIGVE
jgi:DAK2 domain fusion protein YloV